MDHWEPAHADHAIDNVNVLFTFTEPVDGDSFDELIIPLRRAAGTHNFTNRVELQEPAIPPFPAVGQFPAFPGQQLTINVGSFPMTRRVAFQRQAEGIVASEFSIGIGSFTMWTVRYRRWFNFFTELADLFRAIDQVWPLSQRIKSIRIQYSDRFVSVPGGASHFEVLAADPEFLVIPQNDPTAAFHVHNGWFDYNSIPGVRVLTNINIDATDVRGPGLPGQGRTMTFLTLMQYESLEAFLPDPLAQADALHQRLKNLFGTLISPEAAARVGLSG